MRLNDFRIGWRMLLQQPAYSAVVVLGLSAGFAACFLLLSFARYCFNYDAHVPGNGEVFVVKQKRNLMPRPDWQSQAALPLRALMQNSGMPLTVATSIEVAATAKVGGGLQSLALRAVNHPFGEMFGGRPLEGDLAQTLSRPDQIALTASSARRLFGATHVMGKTVVLFGQAMRVGAVLNDPPSNSTVPFDGLLGESAKPDEVKEAMGWWPPVSMWIRLGPGAKPDTVLGMLQDAVDRSPESARLPPFARQTLAGRPATELRLSPLSGFYFDPDMAASRAGERFGQRGLVLGLAAVGALILLLAATNYINLATVRTLQRQREIGVRKVMGASAARLVFQFMAESMVVTLAATALGLLLAWLLLPLFADLVNRPLAGLFTPARLAAALLVGVLVGAAAALYPAWIALNMRAAASLSGRGTGAAPQGSWVWRGLTVFQFAAAMALTGGAVAVAWQAAYASGAPPGFDPSPLLVLDLPKNAAKPAREAFREQLARLPGVTGVAGISEAVGRDGNKIVGLLKRKDGSQVGIELKLVSPEFFEVYRIQPLFGRLFDSALDKPQEGRDVDSVVLNASAAAALGFDSPQAAVGQLTGQGDRVLGIAPDIRFQTLRHRPEPILYALQRNSEVLTVRAEMGAEAGAGQGGYHGTSQGMNQGTSQGVHQDTKAPDALRARIEALWQRHFPNDILNLKPAGDLFAPNYRSDQRLARTLAMASLVATALAAFGIYVLAGHNVRRRAKEIVLRKLHGASPRAVGQLLGREFALLTGAGALLGLPLAGLGIEHYLASFVERAPMGFWPLAAAFGMAALVALAASLRHTLAAMRMPPALALRD